MSVVYALTVCLVFGTKSIAAADECGVNANAISPFNVKEYLGVWHQIVVNKRFSEVFERDYPLCVYANYSLFANGSVSVVNTGFNSKGESNVAYGVATQPTADTGALLVSFNGAPPGPYNVIKMLLDDSDGNYAVAMVWSCSALGLIEDLWILARDYQISQQDYNAMISYAVASGIDVEKLGLLNTTQTDCKI